MLVIGGVAAFEQSCYKRWMAPAEASQLPIDLLKPFPVEEMKAWRVGSAVGNARNSNPELLVPTA
jgi:putative SOS response-associated peptidase YedK